MKKIAALFAVLIVISFYACDKIEGPTRENISVDTTCAFVEDNSVAVKKVLVEEYTGHNCGNCPEGSVLLNDTLRIKYGDDIVVVSVHAGDYANACPGMLTCPGNAPAGSFGANYKTTCGEDWNNTFLIQFYPAGMIDRIDFPSDNVKPKGIWDQKIQDRLNLPAKARIRIQNTYTDSDRKLRACIETKFMEAMSGDYKLSVVLTEDSIIDWQVWYNHNPVLVQDYVHHHMLRGALNTSFGVNVASGAISAGTTNVSGYSMEILSGWNPDHCKVVAFIYDVATYEVLQVEELKIK
jgi:hypothetical protein